MAKRKPTIIALMNRVLGRTFKASSWDTWRAVLKAVFALPLTDTELAIYRELTGRQHPPTEPVREVWLLLGRRSGKSIMAAVIAVYCTCVRQYTVAPGETPTFLVIAADRSQARIVKRYISGLLQTAPSLQALVAQETADSIVLTNGVVIEIATASHRVTRGYTIIGAVCDEMAFWRSEESADPDREVLTALRPGMSTVPDAMLIVLSSVYSRRGETWRTYGEHYGQEDDPVLVVKGPTRAFNPTVSQSVIDAAYTDDPTAAAAEWGAEFRTDIAGFVSIEVVDAATITGRYELPSMKDIVYTAFVDAAGGSGADAMTLAIAHVNDAGVAVLDLVREIRPPFSPEAVTVEFATTMKPYTTRAGADRYAGDWPSEQFAKHGITIVPAAHTKSALYIELLPALNSERIELLDLERLRQQLIGLERRTGQSGRDAVDHTPGGHDDVINAAAGALVIARRRANQEPLTVWGGPGGVVPQRETFEERVKRRLSIFPCDF